MTRRTLRHDLNEELGPNAFLHGGAATHKPFPNLSRGLQESVQNGPANPDADIHPLHAQPDCQMLSRPSRGLKVEVKAVAWPVRAIPDQNYADIKYCGCNRKPCHQVTQQQAQIGDHFVYPSLSFRPVLLRLDSSFGKRVHKLIKQCLNGAIRSETPLGAGGGARKSDILSIYRPPASGKHR